MAGKVREDGCDNVPGHGVQCLEMSRVNDLTQDIGVQGVSQNRLALVIEVLKVAEGLEGAHSIYINRASDDAVLQRE